MGNNEKEVRIVKGDLGFKNAVFMRIYEFQ
jgi:hypothetical protein